MTLRKTWLVQRLHPPRSFNNPFSFGGGLKNGGLSSEAFELLRGIFSFDYMGAAEYEFGEVPKTFSRIAKKAGNGTLVAATIAVRLKDVPASYSDKRKDLPGVATIFILGDIADIEEIKGRVHELAKKNPETKGGLHLNRALRPISDWDSDNQGWLEMDNDFMFFTDETMWQKTAELFGVDTENLL
jgi:hypothetical protein